LLLAARASASQHDEEAARNYTAQAVEIYRQLEQKWGTEAFQSYQGRPDIQILRKQLGGL
jgi:hypothetical protein